MLVSVAVSAWLLRIKAITHVTSCSCFSRDCLKTLITNSKEARIDCPYAQCHGYLLDREIKKLVNEEEYEKYFSRRSTGLGQSQSVKTEKNGSEATTSKRKTASTSDTKSPVKIKQTKVETSVSNESGDEETKAWNTTWEQMVAKFQANTSTAATVSF